MSVWSDIWSQVQLAANAVEQNEPGIGATLPATPEGQAVANSSGFFGAITGFLTALTDGRTWASVGWVVLGLALTIAGLVMWLKKSNYLPSVVPLPV